MFGAFYTDGQVKMVLEYMDGGSLNNYKLIEESVLSNIALQILNGLGYPHF